MKFTVSVSSLVFVLPLLLAQVHASPFGRTGAGGFGNTGSFGAKGATGNKGVTAAAPSAAAAAATATVVSVSSDGADAVASASGGDVSVSVAVGSAAAATAAAATATAAAAASTAAADTGDIQTSLTLDPSVIAPGFANDGQDAQEAGQVPSLTSTNNFINFCASTGLNITNGQQIVGGSCNPAPMGIIAAQSNMPSSKFIVPTNGQTFQEKQPFTIQMSVQNLETGFFVNPNENYFAAPQQVTSAGNIQGHSHVVIDFLDSMTQTTPTNPQKFAFFKGLNAAAVNGVLNVDVTDGLPAGSYRLASINTAANHQPVLVAVAQHGALDDMVYFNVVANGTDASSVVNVFSSSAAAAAATATAAAASSAAPAAASAAAASAAAASAAPAAAAASAAPPAASLAVKGGKAPAKGVKGGKRFEIRRSRL